jgi:hypothetical protein
MRSYRIKAQAPRRVLALTKHLGADVPFITARCILGGLAMVAGVMFVIGPLGAMWFLVIQPALH